MRTVLAALCGVAVLGFIDITMAAPAHAQYYGPSDRYDRPDRFRRYDRPRRYRPLVCVTRYRSCAAGPSFRFPGQYCECRLSNYGRTVPGVTR